MWCSKKRHTFKNGPLRNTSINGIPLQRLAIQNYIKLSISKNINELKRNLGYMRCYNWSSLKPVRNSVSSTWDNSHRICSGAKRLEKILEIKKHVSLQNALICSPKVRPSNNSDRVKQKHILKRLDIIFKNSVYSG